MLFGMAKEMDPSCSRMQSLLLSAKVHFPSINTLRPSQPSPFHFTSLHLSRAIRANIFKSPFQASSWLAMPPIRLWLLPPPLEYIQFTPGANSAKIMSTFYIDFQQDFSGTTQNQLRRSPKGQPHPAHKVPQITSTNVHSTSGNK